MLHASEDTIADASAVFALFCEVEKWPVWLSLARSVRRVEPERPLGLGSEVVLRVPLLARDEEAFVVERFVAGHLLYLESAYSCRRSWELRVERKGERARINVKLSYGTYGGWTGAQLDRLTRQRRVAAELAASVVHFKGLVEFENDPSTVLADF